MVPLRRIRILAAIIAFVGIGGASAPAADDPHSRWLHGFVLVQTGGQLAERGLWPLALANYLAAMEQYRSLAESHPDFQKRLVDYRIADLKTRVAQANESMSAGEHDLAMHYEDVIETARAGATRRYSLDFAASYRHLLRAQWQLKELLDHSPEPVVTALKEQRDWIDEITEETREDLMREPGGGLKIHDIEKEFAKSFSIALSDLPSFKSVTFEETETGMSSALFPEALVLQARSEWYYY
jgi:hypothetical protein